MGNSLFLNLDKTEALVIGPKRFREALLNCIIILDHISLASSSTARNLGVIFKEDLSFNAHIKHVTKLSFFNLRNIKKIKADRAMKKKTGLKSTQSWFVGGRLTNTV